MLSDFDRPRIAEPGLSKSSVQGMSHVTMVIKAVRWAFRTLQVDSLSVSMGAIISSFHKGISADRRESLPFSLFTLMHFERRILMRECSEYEIVILGMCLFLAFSGLRFSDMQRTNTSSLHWNGSVLRGTCWRTKTERTGQPFGLIGSGFLSTESLPGYSNFFKRLIHFLQFMVMELKIILCPAAMYMGFDHLPNHCHTLKPCISCEHCCISLGGVNQGNWVVIRVHTQFMA